MLKVGVPAAGGRYVAVLGQLSFDDIRQDITELPCLDFLLSNLANG